MEDARASLALPPLPAIEPGSVWLVGAGPGDPGLLTLHAANALRLADCVVYDALVSPEILALARPGAALEYAGKRGGQDPLRSSRTSATAWCAARGRACGFCASRAAIPSSSAAAARRP